MQCDASPRPDYMQGFDVVISGRQSSRKIHRLQARVELEQKALGRRNAQIEPQNLVPSIRDCGRRRRVFKEAFEPHFVMSHCASGGGRVARVQVCIEEDLGKPLSPRFRKRGRDFGPATCSQPCLEVPRTRPLPACSPGLTISLALVVTRRDLRDSALHRTTSADAGATHSGHPHHQTPLDAPANTATDPVPTRRALPREPAHSSDPNRCRSRTGTS